MQGRSGLAHLMRLTTWWGVVAVLAALVPSIAEASGARTRIHGGQATPIADVPYQVALIDAAAPSEFDGQFCGGTILDERRVMTAAHCVFDSLRPGMAFHPADVKVMAGRELLSRTGMSDDLHAVEKVSFDAGYDLATGAGDAAVLTLTMPLDLTTPVAAPATLGTVGDAPRALVSGWGESGMTELGGRVFPTELRKATLPIVADEACAEAYEDYAPFVAEKMLCAGGEAGIDSCSGDSGGPLVINQDLADGLQPRLVGIVSFGPYPCGQPGRPGVYTEVADPEIHDYLTTEPTDAPRFEKPPSITREARVGERLTCSPGSWSGSPAFSYRFVRHIEDSVSATAPSPTTTYTPTAADLGATFSCVVEARNDGGFGFAESIETARVAPALPVEQPPVQQPPAPTPVTPAPAVDEVPPVARVVKASCKGRRCVVDVRVTDPGVSAGIRRLEAKVRSTYKATCRKRGRRATCTKRRTRTAKARRIAANRYRLVLRSLPVGSHVVTVAAVDRAGNRQLVSDRRTLRVKRAKR